MKLFHFYINKPPSIAWDALNFRGPEKEIYSCMILIKIIYTLQSNEICDMFCVDRYLIKFIFHVTCQHTDLKRRCLPV